MSINAIKVTVGTAADRIIDNGAYTPTKSIVLKADDDNSNSVYIGGPSVSVAQNGFRLKAGQMVPMIDVIDLAEIYAIGGAAAQVLWVLWS